MNFAMGDGESFRRGKLLGDWPSQNIFEVWLGRLLLSLSLISLISLIFPSWASFPLPARVFGSPAAGMALINKILTKNGARKEDEEDVMSENLAPPARNLNCKLSDFDILQTLGTGSFGRVHLVRHRASKAYYAMKVLKKAEVVRLKQVEHTLNEKNILAKIDHPFIVNMFGAFQDDNFLYVVMEYVSGGELFTYLRKSQVS
jgi:hypothetical protein